MRQDLVQRRNLVKGYALGNRQRQSLVRKRRGFPAQNGSPVDREKKQIWASALMDPLRKHFPSWQKNGQSLVYAGDDPGPSDFGRRLELPMGALLALAPILRVSLA